MSNRTNDIRAYVERLFLGRTLTEETIDLKEEVFGNLVARYEDYLAEGMSEDEAFARTCEAVTSVDDVLDGSEKDVEPETPGEKGTEPEGEAATAAPEPDDTSVWPGAPVPPEGTAAAAGAVGSGPKRPGWQTALVVVAAVAVVLVVAQLALGAANAFDPAQTQEDTSQTSQVVSEPQEADPRHNVEYVIVTSELSQEILDHDPASFADSAPDATSDLKVVQLMALLPLGPYLGDAGISNQEKTELWVDYAYATNEYLAEVDDDAIECALVYNAMAVFCAEPDVLTLEIRLNETERGESEPDREVYRFERTSLEQLLDTVLTPERLTDGSWDGLRDKAMTKVVWDAAIEQAELD